MTDIEIRQLREDLITVINDAPLLLEIKRLVVGEVYQMVTKASEDFIAKQRQDIVRQVEEGPVEKDETQSDEQEVIEEDKDTVN